MTAKKTWHSPDLEKLDLRETALGGTAGTTVDGTIWDAKQDDGGAFVKYMYS